MTHDFRNQRLPDQQVDELIDDLELRCRADLTAAREMSTAHRKVGIAIRPGNATERRKTVEHGETIELRGSGMTSLTPTPIAVGDVYHLTFDRSSIDIEPLLAVCDRCTMLGEDSFEARFRFVHDVVLPMHERDQD